MCVGRRFGDLNGPMPSTPCHGQNHNLCGIKLHIGLITNPTRRHTVNNRTTTPTSPPSSPSRSTPSTPARPWASPCPPEGCRGLKTSPPPPPRQRGMREGAFCAGRVDPSGGWGCGCVIIDVFGPVHQPSEITSAPPKHINTYNSMIEALHLLFLLYLELRDNHQPSQQQQQPSQQQQQQQQGPIHGHG